MTQERKSQHHDPEEIARHDDPARDRLFAGREQHDEAEKNSEANREDRRGRADEHSDDRGRGPGSSGRGSTGRPNGG